MAELSLHLLSDAKGRENACQHVFGGRFTCDLAKISERVMQADKNYLFARFVIQKVDRIVYLARGSHEQVMMARVGDQKTARRNVLGRKRLNDSFLKIIKPSPVFAET